MKKLLTCILALLLVCGAVLPASAAWGGTLTPGYPSAFLTLSRADGMAEYTITTTKPTRFEVALGVTASSDVPYELMLICNDAAGNDVFFADINSTSPNEKMYKNGTSLNYNDETTTLPAGTYRWLVAVPEYQWQDTPSLTLSHYLLLIDPDTREGYGITPGDTQEPQDAYGITPGDTLSFYDVFYEDWYFDAVEYVTANGLFQGTSSTQFSPDQAMTRGMLVTILGRNAGVNESGSVGSTGYNDVYAGDYYAVHIKWATGQGIVSGTGGGKFSPNATLSRQDMVTMLYNYVRASGGDLSSGSAKFNSFYDTSSIAGYAVEPMRWAVHNGIIGGTDAHHLSPWSSATRAQVAQIIYNARDFLKGSISTAIVTPPVTVAAKTYVCYTDANGFDYASAYRPSVTINANNTFTLTLNYGEGMGSGSGTWAATRDASGTVTVVLTITSPSGWSDDPSYTFRVASDGSLVLAGGYMGITPTNSVYR